MIRRVRGTEDYLNTNTFNYLINTVKKHLENYHFQEIKTPLLEHTNLFIHSLGQETDVVSKEMYVFNPEDKDSVCLRPEGTAAIIRACVENKVQRFPWKVFSHGPMFRRERPQKGRLRQFHQVSVEVINTPIISYDAQLIKMFQDLFSHVFRLENYILKINFLGTLEDRKEHKKELISFLEKHNSSLCQTCLTRKDANTLRVFDCKNPECQKLYKNAPKLTDFLSEQSAQEWQELQQTLELLSVNFIIDPYLVRGLDYYQKTVFEFCSRDLGAQNAFCAGGRYLLGKQAGAQNDFDSIGAAIGIERMLILFEENNISVPEQDKPLTVILPLAKEQDALALMLASNLRSENIKTDIVFEKASMTNMMKKANRMSARHVIIIGDDEQKQNIVSVKDMKEGSTEKVSQTELVNFLKKA